jgi:hypothetical protein
MRGLLLSAFYPKLITLSYLRILDVTAKGPALSRPGHSYATEV